MARSDPDRPSRSNPMLAPELGGRLNGLFMTFVFRCGGMGSVLALAFYVLRGWTALAVVATAFVMPRWRSTRPSSMPPS